MTWYIERKDLKVGKIFINPNLFLAPDCECKAGTEISKIARYEGYQLTEPDRWVSLRCPKCKKRIFTTHFEMEDSPITGKE